jgi:hypothetical protein
LISLVGIYLTLLIQFNNTIKGCRRRSNGREFTAVSSKQQRITCRCERRYVNGRKPFLQNSRTFIATVSPLRRFDNLT